VAVSSGRVTSSPSPAADLVVSLRSVTVRLGGRVVLRDVSLDLARGSYLEVRGDNGSGKTTLLRLIAGVCPPNSGERRAVRSVAFVPAAIQPPALAVGSWLVAIRDRQRPVADALGVLGFDGRLDRSFRRLSYGNFRKVLLADALTSTGGLVVLDEARQGLDEAGLRGLQALVRDSLGGGATVVVADQRAHAVPPHAEGAVVAGGAVRVAARAQVSEATLALRGPVSRLAEVEEAAAKLGFRRVDG
jgi:ABC-type Mn2+/Zn2+ transport system ATPase subunit